MLRTISTSHFERRHSTLPDPVDGRPENAVWFRNTDGAHPDISLLQPVLDELALYASRQLLPSGSGEGIGAIEVFVKRYRMGERRSLVVHTDEVSLVTANVQLSSGGG